MPNRSLLKTPASAAFLSFLFPGLGQLAAGRPRRGLVVALPALTLSVAVAGFFLFARRQIYDAIFSADALTSFFLIDVAILLYRLWAIVDAFLVAGGPGARTGLAPKIQTKEPAARARQPLTVAVLGAVMVATIGTHLALGAVDVQYRDTLSSIFNPNAPSWFGGNGDLPSGQTAAPFSNEPGATDVPATPSASPGLAESPSGSPAGSAPGSPFVLPTPGPTTAAGIPIFPVEDVSGPDTPSSEWAADGKLNVLLVGADSGVGRWSLRTDTMILLEVDIASGRAVMYGLPRNLENVPLPPESANAFACHCFPYPNLLNALWRDAVNRPSAYPYSGTDFVRGFKALEGAIGQYLGLHVDGAVVINLMGFVNLIDALGGININVPAEVKDSQYSRPQDGKDISIDIKPGYQHMDGLVALEYARSRHQDSDYGRMSRQQAVLLALRAQLQPCSLLSKVPSLISALGSAFWTDMPVEDAPSLLALAERIGTSNVKSIELVPSVTGNPVGFLTVPRWATVRDIVAHGLDGVPPAGGSGGGGGGGGFGC
ncbi:MAG: LCP family protein [Candidatus Limnocylindrales bacterium]|jgi:LCP family protein required for cell wall assembly